MSGVVLACMVVGTGAGHAATAVRDVRFVGSGINLRTAPSTGAGVVRTLSGADHGVSYCQDRGADNYTWIKVYVDTGGGQGWVRGDFARPDGPLQNGHCDVDLGPHYS